VILLAVFPPVGAVHAALHGGAPKLREMINRLERENLGLLAEIDEKDAEIRRLRAEEEKSKSDMAKWVNAHNMQADVNHGIILERDQLRAEVESLRKTQLLPERVICIRRCSFCGSPWEADEHAMCSTCKNLWSEIRYVPVEVKP
jgi:hypothetical protein